MPVAYHTHTFEIPTATNAEVAAGIVSNKAVTPAALGSAAAVSADEFATSAQGALADTALQPGDAASPAQGVLADTAMQPAVYDPQGKDGDPFPYDTEALAAAATIAADIHSIELRGSATVGDGLGGLYIDTDNGSTDTFTSSGGSARSWYRAADVGIERLTRNLNAFVKTAVPSFDPNIEQNNTSGKLFCVAFSRPGTIPDSIMQGFSWDDREGHFFVSYSDDSEPEQNTFVCNSSSGAVIGYTAVQNFGHPQDYATFYNAGVLSHLTSNLDDDGCTIFEWDGTGAGAAVSNIRNYVLFDGGLATVPNLSLDRRYIVAKAFIAEDVYKARIFDLASILGGATGDRSSEYLCEIDLLPGTDYAFADANQNVVQGITMDAGYVYVLTGFAPSTTIKYLSCFSIATKARLWRIAINSGRLFAEASGDGSQYEMEGLTWVRGGPTSVPQLWLGMSCRQTDNTGRDNFGVPIHRILGTVSMDGGSSPLSIGALFYNASHDIAFPKDENLQISTVDLSGRGGVATNVGQITGSTGDLEWNKAVKSPYFSTVTTTIADDGAYSIDLPPDLLAANIEIVSRNYGAVHPRGWFWARSFSDLRIFKGAFVENDTNFVFTTGALTGTTGTDGKFTFSVHSDNKVYFENRSGISQRVAIKVTGL